MTSKRLTSLKHKITFAFYIIVGMALFNGIIALLLSHQLRTEIEDLVTEDVVKVSTALELAKDTEKLQIITTRLNHYDNELQRLQLLSELATQWGLLIDSSRTIAKLETSPQLQQAINNIIDTQLYYMQQIPLLSTLTDNALQAKLQAGNIQANLTSLASSFGDKMQVQLKQIHNSYPPLMTQKDLNAISNNIKENQFLSEYLHQGEHLFTLLTQVKNAEHIVALNQLQREAMRHLISMETVLAAFDKNQSIYVDWLSQIKQNVVGDDNLFELSRNALKSNNIANAHLTYQANAAQLVATFTQTLVEQVGSEIQKAGGDLKNHSTAFVLLIFCGGVLYCFFIWLTSWHFIDKGIIKPVIATRDAMDAIANEKLDTPMPITDNLELQQMVNSLATLKTYAAQVKAMAETDGLTGCYNRRYLDNQIEKELLYANDHQVPLSIVMFDIDNFKQFNDRYGHVIGDQCLKQIVNAAKSILQRPTDTLARYGGEEFMILLPSRHLEDAYKIAEHLRETIIDLKIPHEDSPHAGIVTISAGITCWHPPERLDTNSLIKRADEALYHAKLTGRNRTETLINIPLRYY
ncbi:diguanylate cyclase [Shewanella putrefaciens]|uniref:diguanylate cyclase n=1 Tax=Shewanella putrefaciens TaxID=24 RepID=A0ABX8X8H5_SHEPU|nr:diguanylate cyclase [Shewanella putrefaciens]AVV85898.1 deoxyguanosine kinase [Shewanella putrefaciens]MCA1896310.1 GGDEF domain-containing protein [Shewanella putrefaciens]MCT8944822.1 GGDEF domain-containing protein [Shewanella putrefaciens]QSE48350.1 diguanylate cyclase [Shewanella putrefaciens]QYX71755.1 GGDEF domain-containing protein [Shewanella putrefaciens]